MTATLSVSNGVITLTQTSGLTFHPGFGNGTATVVFDGTITDVNNALASVNYTSNVAFSGTDILTVTVNDNGNTGSGGPQQDSKTISISVGPVNHPPVNTVPGQQTVNEDTTLTFSSPINPISIADPENTGSNIYQVTLSVAHGALTLSSTAGLTFLTGDGTQDPTMTVQGTIAAINAALNGLQYLPSSNFNSLPPNGPDALVITTNDLGNSGPGGPLQTTSSVSISVNPVNDAPVITVNAPSPGGNTALEGQTFTFSGASSIVVSDVDAGTGNETVTLTVPAAQGTLSLPSHSGLSETGTQIPADSGSGSTPAWTNKTQMVFQGTLASINAALTSLVFTSVADFSGTATVTINVNDQGNTGSGGVLQATATSSVVYTDVNDAPTINPLQSSIAFLQSGSTQTFTNSSFFTGISVGSSFETAAGQRLTVSSLTFTNAALFATTPTSALNTAAFLAPNIPPATADLNFVIAANKSGSSTITVTLTDNGDTLNGGVNTVTKTITISVAPVNQPPSFGGFPATPLSATEDTSKQVTFSVADVDSNGASEQLTLSVSNGTLTVNTGVSSGVTPGQVSGQGTSTVVITAPIAAINTTLANATGLQYKGTQDFNNLRAINDLCTSIHCSPRGPATDWLQQSTIWATPVVLRKPPLRPSTSRWRRWMMPQR